MESEKEAQEALQLMNKSEVDGKEITVEISKRNKPHHSTPGIYLGPSSTSRRRTFSPKRRYRRSPSRSRSYHRERERERDRDKYYKKPR
jgi:RNA recognition motif-containing protein